VPASAADIDRQLWMPCRRRWRSVTDADSIRLRAGGGGSTQTYIVIVFSIDKHYRISFAFLAVPCSADDLVAVGAVVAREYGLPCVVNVSNATVLFSTGRHFYDVAYYCVRACSPFTGRASSL